MDAAEMGTFCEHLGSKFSCDVVNKSMYSELFHVPVSMLGILWNLFLVFFAWSMPRNRALVALTLAWNLFGLLFVVYFIYGEWMLSMICPLCTLVHLITLASTYCAWRLYREEQLGKAPLEELNAWLHPTPPFTPSLFHGPSLPLLKSLRPWFWRIFIVHLAVLLLFNLYPIPESTPPSNMILAEHLSKCLTQQKIGMYGLSTCSVCQQQKKMFGEAFKNIVFVECKDEYEKECNDREVEQYPTWIKFSDQIHGKEIQRLAGLQSLETLASTFNCNMDIKKDSDS
jgi:hypothetical protein